MSPAVARRRALVGLFLMLVGVIVGGTVQTSTPNGQTLLALVIIAAGGYLWISAVVRGDR